MKKKAGKKTGRPPKPLNEKHSEYICLKLKPDQYNYLKKAARQFNTTPATYVRSLLFSEKNHVVAEMVL